MRHSRRDAIKLLGASATAAVSAQAAGTGPLAVDDDLSGELLNRAHYFPLSDVRVGDGPFFDAQRRDAKYLLSLEPDRMLANFRSNAGLPPKAQVYGGWESVEPWIWIRCHGHTLGHYLGACASMFESTGDARFAERVDYIVAELASCQRERGGLICAFPDGAAPLLDSLAGKEFAGVPWYTMHKIMAGLRDAFVHRGSTEAKTVLARLATWIADACEPVNDTDFQKMLDREHGGMTEILADTFEITGDRRIYRLAERFVHRALYEPLKRNEDKLDGLHANTQIPKVVGLQRLYELDGTAGFNNAAKFFWQTVTGPRSFATGGHGDGEHFFPAHEYAAHLGSAKTMETCCTHNMLRLTRSLYGRDPQARYFDYFERALFNGILASQDRVSGMTTYFQATRPGYVKLFHTPIDSFWCCTGSGMESHARYGESIYSHDGGTLAVNLFIASTLDWKTRGVRVLQATRFPEADVTRLTFECREASNFTLALRQPAWCPVMTVSVNGRERQTCRLPGTYTRIARSFRNGDVVEVRVPMTVRTESLPNDPDHAALMYGPLVLAGIFYGNPVNPADQLIVNERESGQMLNDTVQIPRWTRSFDELVANTKLTNPKSLVFLARGFEGGQSVKLIPWFRVSNERYNLYWHSAHTG